MKKLYVILIALACSLVCIIGFDSLVKQKLKDNLDKAIYYNNIFSRNSSDYMMDQILDENSIVVLGSSELAAEDNLAYPPSIFNNGYSDFNIILMGKGGMHTLAQTINVGALQNNIKNSKIVLIMSPQWFTAGGVSTASFSSRFEEANFIEFLQNDNVSKESKIAVTNRVNELLASDPIELERMQKFEDVYLYHDLNPIKYCEISVYNIFSKAKLRFTILDELSNMSNPIDYDNYIEVDKIDFSALISQAQKLGEEACTNNEYGILDDYFDANVRARYEEMRDSKAESSYVSSIEYDDFRLFLNVCEETGIKPLIISVPVNGRWYDYTGFPKWDRNTYYQNIRDICNEYEVELVDFSDKEYEMYYLKDESHLGVKGWVYLDQAVYSFYKGEDIKDNTVYESITLENMKTSNGKTIINNNIFLLSTAVEENSFNSVMVTIAPDNVIVDMTASEGIRSGVYLHNGESGSHTIQFKANSNCQDEYVSWEVYLEQGKVYKVSYTVDVLESKRVVISDINLAQILY